MKFIKSAILTGYVFNLLALSACDTGRSTASGGVAQGESKVQSLKTLSDLNHNIKILDTVHNVIIARGIPEAPRMVDVNKYVPDLLDATGLESLSLKGSENAVLVYRAEGGEYKLVIFDEMTCSEAFLQRPELVDPRRKRRRSGNDCLSYGYWTEAVADNF